MRPANRKQPSDRVIKAAQTALATRKYVSLLDVLVGIGLIPGRSNAGSRGRSTISRRPYRPICRAFLRP